MTPPLATYRIQLHAGFDFGAAAEVVPYLARLGISHVYTSPILQAEAGSMHGYDVVDHSRISDELGGAVGLDGLVHTLREHRMGLVVDLVPNHMAISSANRWWWDVLEHGPASRYAGYFDVDWDPPESRLRNVILLPVLADHYGRVLESGGITLQREGRQVEVHASGQRFAVDPGSLAPILAEAAARVELDELAFIGRALRELPPSTTTAAARVEVRQRDAAVLGDRFAALLENDRVAAALDAELAALNGSADRLDAFLEQQNYRLAFWRSSSRDLGYRRFFDINTLVGLRVERQEVFEATHRLILDRVDAGDVQGLRIDHPDGLRDPAGYFARLRAAAPDAWIVAEKILEPGEELPDWPIDGTTGYRFANLVTQLQVDPEAERAMTDAYVETTGANPKWEEVAHAARRHALARSLGSDLNRLTDLWLTICEANRRYRDFTRHELHEALGELAAGYAVYRTYVRPGPGGVDERDRAVVGDAVQRARDRRPDLDPDLFAFLAAILLLEVSGDAATELAVRFQQLTPAAMAKGVEDTAFYRYLRMVALNEVGGDPGRFGHETAPFHEALADDGRRWPAAMLATSTHDTKRSGDVRARLALLSEVPERWREAVTRLRERAAPHRTAEDLPGAPAEYLFLQVAVGAWPLSAERAVAYMTKATREAKDRTSWTDPDPAFDAALQRFVHGCLSDGSFTGELERLVTDLLPAWRTNALAQLLWKLTVPGVPDLYQGTELWDLSLVDPDNRRPVDFALRTRLLAEADRMEPDAVAGGAGEGLPKLWLAHRALALRARRPGDLGAGAAYRPLAVSGPAARHAVAYRRGEGVVALGTRLPLRLEAAGGWRDTLLALPDGRWCDVLTDAEVPGGDVRVQRLLATFPVALLERRP